jgi:hypothetical protein
MDLQTDPYTALLGPDGKGQMAANIAGTAKLLRVKPGDPAGSFLPIKLQIKIKNNPQYGAGMPLSNPGSVCPDTIAQISQWIAGGALNN